MSIKIGILASSSPAGGGTNPAATAFFNRVTAAGGTLTTNEQNAINTLVNSLQSANIWNKLLCIYPMVGASAASCAQNLKSSSFTGSFTNTGWSFTSNGVLPNGTTAYMDTFFTPLNFSSINNFHISYYSRTQNITFNGGCMGQGDNFNIYPTYIAPYYAGTGTKFFLNGSYPANAAAINNTITLGLILGNKSAVNSKKLFLNSTLLTTNTNSYTASVQNFSYYLGGINYGTGSVSFPTAFECALASLGDSFTDLEEASFYNIVQTFQTSLSRQV